MKDIHISDKQIAAAETLFADAEKVHEELLDELTAKRRKLMEQQETLGKEIKALDSKINDLSYNLDCLRGVVPNDKTQHIYSKKHHVKDEVILAFLVDRGECTTGEVQDYFKFSSATVCRRLDALLKAKKVTLCKGGTTKYWMARA